MCDGLCRHDGHYNVEHVAYPELYFSQHETFMCQESTINFYINIKMTLISADNFNQ